MFTSRPAAPRFWLISPENFWKSHEPHGDSRHRVPLPASRFPPMNMIDLRYVKKLVEMLDESSVDSIEISSDKGMKIRISKTPQQRGAVQMTAPMAMPALLPAAAPAASQGDATGTAVGGAEGERKSKILEMKSPNVCTHYGTPEADAK